MAEIDEILGKELEDHAQALAQLVIDEVEENADFGTDEMGIVNFDEHADSFSDTITNAVGMSVMANERPMVILKYSPYRNEFSKYGAWSDGLTTCEEVVRMMAVYALEPMVRNEVEVRQRKITEQREGHRAKVDVLNDSGWYWDPKDRVYVHYKGFRADFDGAWQATMTGEIQCTCPSCSGCGEGVPGRRCSECLGNGSITESL